MRRRFRYSAELDKMFEVTDDYISPGPIVHDDRQFQGLRATDGTDISSRTKQREYMKRNDLVPMEEFKGEWSKAAKARADYFQGRTGSVNKSDIAGAISQLESRGRKR